MTEQEQERIAIMMVDGGVDELTATAYIMQERAGMKFTIKVKTDGKWGSVPLTELGDATVEQLFETLEGMDAIVEVFDGDVNTYICGTPELAKKFTDRGDVTATFPEGIEWLKVAAPDLLAFQCPVMYGEVFPCAQLEVVSDIPAMVG
jgi:hypothetical protein